MRVPLGSSTSGPPIPATARRRCDWGRPTIRTFSSGFSCVRFRAMPRRRFSGTGAPANSASPKRKSCCRASKPNRSGDPMSRLTVCSVTALVALIAGLSAPSIAVAQQATVAAINRGVVEIETSGAAGISVRIAEDLANLIDDGTTRRVVPVVGKGSLQSLTDLKYLRGGVDMAILQTDVLDYAKEQRLLPGLESSLSYITRLYNEEFHLLAGPDVKSVTELTNKKVNVDLPGSGTAITASRLFDSLKIAVTVTNDSQEVALDKLRRGEIAAVAFVAGKPAPLFMGLKGDDGLHFLTVPFNPAASSAYAPTQLSAADYPGLVAQGRPVETVAIGSVLAVADLRQLTGRYRNVDNFVDIFFTEFQSLLMPGHHPKWQEVNLAAELPGWRRYPPADQWLHRNVQVAGVPNPDDLKQMFARFLDERRQAMGHPARSQQGKNELFQQFQSWHG